MTREPNNKNHITEQPAASDAAERMAADRTAGERPRVKKKLTREQKRKRVENRISRRMALVFFAFALLIAIFLLVVPRSTVSTVEKRSLATFPTFSFANYFSGEFTSGITEYYDDTVPGRDALKNAGNNVKSLFGITSGSTAEIIGNVALRNNSTTEETTVAEEATEAAVEVETTTEEETTADTINSKDFHAENADASYEDGILVVNQENHWRALALYGGEFVSLYSDTVNYMRSILSDDINIYFMPVPTAAQFYLPANYADYSVDQQAVMQDHMAAMSDGITCIDICDILNNHNEEAIYLRTDHHWAPLGAYYAAREFASVADVPFADLSEYTEYVNEGYVGTMYAYTESANILNDPEDFVYYIPYHNYTVDYYDRTFTYSWTGGLFFDVDVDNSYLTFLGGDDKIVKITTSVDNGRKLLVIKDSYGNAEVPFLTGSFQEIYVIDQRYFEVNLINFINYNGITDILLTHNIFSLAGAEAELLEDIVYNYQDAVISDDAPEAELPTEEETTTAADEAETETETSVEDETTAAADSES